MAQWRTVEVLSCHVVGTGERVLLGYVMLAEWQQWCYRLRHARQMRKMDELSGGPEDRRYSGMASERTLP